MRTQDFHYDLPPELIAQQPAAERDASRLLVLDRETTSLSHTRFTAIREFLRPGDLLVLNNSRVIPARLRAIKPGTGGQIEILLVEEVRQNEWWVLLRPGKRVRPGTRLQLLDRSCASTNVAAEVQEKSEEGHYRLTFQRTPDIALTVHEIGEIPLPPYIQRPQGATPEDLIRYQTVYAGPSGSVAAPTAGLHFTPGLLDAVRAFGVETTEVTLHVGLGTFLPVKVESLVEHRMHSERFEISASAAEKINRAKASSRRVIAVGTTSLRLLETAARSNRVLPGNGHTDIFIHPPFRFQIADALLTNFHLPESTLLMLVSAFAAPGETDGRKLILESYTAAVRERYRFFSYGDAMLIL